MLHPLVLAAVALIILSRTEDLGAEQTVPLRFEGPVIDGFRFFYFPERALPDLFRRGDGNPDRGKMKRVLRFIEKIKNIFQSCILLMGRSLRLIGLYVR
jgi:hypothetical protein